MPTRDGHDFKPHYSTPNQYTHFSAAFGHRNAIPNSYPIPHIHRYTSTNRNRNRSSHPCPSDILGIWERITDEHGNEYLSFGEDGTLVYAEGRAENVTELPSITGSYTLETGILSLQTEDCPEVTGTYTIRLLGSKFLKFEILEDTCEGRGDNLTLQPWERYEE